MIELNAMIGLALALGLGSTPHSSPIGDVVCHWIFSRDHLKDNTIQPVEGDWVLPCPDATFVDKKDKSALLLRPGRKSMLLPGGVASNDLPQKACSIEAWVAIDAYTAWGGMFSAMEDNGAAETGILLGTRNKQFTFALSSQGTDDGDGSLTYLLAKDSFQLGRWYHVVGTYDGRTQSIWVDGVLQGESKIQSGGILYEARHKLSLGGYEDQNESYPLVGALHEVALWDECLTKNAITRKYKKLRGTLPASEGATFNPIANPKKPPVSKLQGSINLAIDKGVKHLLKQQFWDGSWNDSIGSYRNGGTSIAIYTLLKCGLQPSHPAIVRGLQFLRDAPPRKVYSAGCQLLALGATQDQEHAPWAQEIVDQLLAWESKDIPGSWGYPHGSPDLSNTQFAALGFWGASQLDININPIVWRRMVERTLDHQPFEAKIPWPKDGSKSRSGKQRIAGFTYFQGGRTYPETGTMTTAGLCVLAIPRMLMGRKLGAVAGRQIESSSTLGLAWLGHHYPEDGDSKVGDNLYYYLYGVERVGAFLETDTIGGKPWYRDGAVTLLKNQTEFGDWGRISNTCFALLFLRKASAASSSGKSVVSQSMSYATQGGEVSLHATGISTMTLWIDGFSKDIMADYEGPDREWRGLRVIRVAYLADGETIAQFNGDPSRAWEGERFPTKHAFVHSGDHTLKVQVTVVAPNGDPEFEDRAETLISKVLKISTEDSPLLRMESILAVGTDDLMRTAEPTATASSTWSDDYEASSAVDSWAHTTWCAAKGAKNPALRIELGRRVRANTLILYQAPGKVAQRDSYAAIDRVLIKINGKDLLESKVESNILAPIVLDLDGTQSIRSLEVRILSYHPNSKGVGISGIELHKR